MTAFSFLKDPASTKNLAGWTFHPPYQVGNRNGSLDLTESNFDHASQTWCGSQRYTSWNCLSRSYISGCIVEVEQVEQQPTPTESNSGLNRNDHSAPSASRSEEEGYYYSDTVPVRVVTTTTIPGKFEDGMSIPYSSFYQTVMSWQPDSVDIDELDFRDHQDYIRNISIMKLAESMSQYSSSVFELAPLVRASCIILATDKSTYQLDPVRLRFVRNVTVPKMDEITIDITHTQGFPESPMLLTAAPINTFVEFLNYAHFHTGPAGFERDGLDYNWIAVPLRSQQIGQAHWLAYVVSFMSSEIWNGTVTVMDNTSAQLDPDRRVRLRNSRMPVCNSVYIPGVTKVMLVLVDDTSDMMQEMLRMGSLNIPIWRGRHAVQPTDITEAWRDYWVGGNIGTIQHDFGMAYTEICNEFGVSDACGLASSIASELYGIWYSGLALKYSAGSIKPNYEEEADGAWTYDASPLDEIGRIKSQKFDLTDANKEQARRRTTGYNFSGHSPWHLLATGMSKVRFHRTGEGGLKVNWSSPTPERSAPGYKITTMSSVFRVGTSTGLIDTQRNTPFYFGIQWHHMLSCALSFSTSVFLTTNDLSPRTWAGMDNRSHGISQDFTLATFKNELFKGVIFHYCAKSLMQKWHGRDIDIVSEYYSNNAFDNADWMTYSAVPSHCTLQWQDKLGITYGNSNLDNKYIMYKDARFRGTVLSAEQGRMKNMYATTINLYKYFPILLAFESCASLRPVKVWFDQVSYYSTALLVPDYGYLLKRSFYETQTLCAQHEPLDSSYSDPARWFLIGSYSSTSDGTNVHYYDICYITEVSSISSPYSPSLDTIWNGAKNYILKPASSTLTAYLSD